LSPRIANSNPLFEFIHSLTNAEFVQRKFPNEAPKKIFRYLNGNKRTYFFNHDSLPFPFNIFKDFPLSFQSSLHLSFTLLVRYRTQRHYLALGEMYLPWKDKKKKEIAPPFFLWVLLDNDPKLPDSLNFFKKKFFLNWNFSLFEIQGNTKK